MKHLALALVVMGCGGGGAGIAPDLSAQVSELDLAVALDLSPSPDLSEPCTPPQAGVYNEQVQFNYAPAGGGTAMYATSVSTAIVRNDGSFARPQPAFAAPTLFHCNFTAIDRMTCLAACCPSQMASPTLYVDKGGWSLWLGGACAFQTTTGAQYVANVTDVAGYFVH